MLFKKRKPKLDPKVRFQHKQFTAKLDNARNFKRTSKAVPESIWQKMFQRAGLSGLWSQIAAGILLLGLLYLIYVPNLLSVRDFSFSGISGEQSEQLEAEIRKVMSEVSIVNPQYNLIFFDPELVKQAAANIPTIDYVASVKKDYKNQTIYIDAASKYERFLVSQPEVVLDVYNDSSIKGVAGVNLDQWASLQNPNMVKVLMHHKFQYSQYQDLFTPQLLSYIKSLLEFLPTVEGQQLAYLTFREPQPEIIIPEIIDPLLDSETPESEQEQSEVVSEPEQPPELEPDIPEVQLPYSASEVHIVFYKNNDIRRTYSVILDATADAAHDLAELRLLLSQTAPDRYDQLRYIDLRIPDKAYLCLESAPCAQ